MAVSRVVSSDAVNPIHVSNDNDHISLRVYMMVIGMARQVVAQESALETLLHEINTMSGKNDTHRLYNQDNISNILEELKLQVGALKYHVESLI